MIRVRTGCDVQNGASRCLYYFRGYTYLFEQANVEQVEKEFGINFLTFPNFDEEEVKKEEEEEEEEKEK